jgi:hypothetical protein
MIIRTLAVGLLAVAATISHAQTPATAPIDDAAHYAGTLQVQPKEKAPKATDPRSYVKRSARSAGFRSTEWKCLDHLIFLESRWDSKADNPRSSAFGLFQQLKLNPKYGVEKQTQLGLKYIKHRYKTPCVALAHRIKEGWY